MTTIAKCLLEAKYAENSQTTQYTAPSGTRVIVDKIVAYNGTAGSVALTVNVVASGGSPSSANVLMSKTIAAGEAYSFPEVAANVLNPGDFISTLAGSASSIVIRVSGREVTQ